VLNVKEPEIMGKFSQDTPPPVVAVCGTKKSGKTTLLSGILPLLREKGIKVAVIKHDGHDFDPDVKGTDSYRLRTAGALGVAVYSAKRFMVVREERPTVEDMIFCFKDMDLILLEGGKNSPYPKLEVIRDGISGRVLCCNSHNLLAICSTPPLQIGNIPCLDSADYHGITEVILSFCATLHDKKQDFRQTVIVNQDKKPEVRIAKNG
jgi:molybdopterin-guanine dinucleotide biosynthesis protein B